MATQATRDELGLVGGGAVRHLAIRCNHGGLLIHNASAPSWRAHQGADTHLTLTSAAIALVANGAAIKRIVLDVDLSDRLQVAGVVIGIGEVLRFRVPR